MSLSESITHNEIASQFLGVAALGLGPERAAPNYERAFDQWEAILGKDHIKFDDTTREDYAKTTLPQGTSPSGVLWPGSSDEVCEVVKIARRYQVPLHAISRGKNWGYGDACAKTDGQVIVDLRRMNRIREVNVELGYAVIEPGVSQGQMARYLRENNIPLVLDVTGAGPDASIVGNILQRGFGHTPYGDRFKHTSGFEVALPDGRLIRTGFGRFENAKAAQVFPWGNGPWIDGLFTQCDFGIVTSACIWLMPTPEVTEGFALKIANADRLGDVLTALRKLRLGGTVRSTVHVANDLRVLSSRISYPWERAGGETPLPESLREELRHEHGLGAWNVLGASFGTVGEVKAARRVIRRALRGVARVHFFRRSKLTLAQRLRPLMRWSRAGTQLAAAVESASSAFDLLEGIPSEAHLQGVHWRSRETESTSVADLRDAGLIWVSPVLPLTASAATEVLAIVEPIFAHYHFDPLITMTAITDRALCCVTSVNYNKEVPSESERAKQCAAALHEALGVAGYYPYRTASCSG